MAKTITVRFEEDDWKLIQKGARADSRTISSLMRKCALDKSRQLVNEVS